MDSTAASSFFVGKHAILVALAASILPGGVRAQDVSFELRAGAAASTPLAEDVVASPRLAQRLGSSFLGDVKAVPTPGLAIGAAARAMLRPRMRAELGFGFTFANVRAQEAGTERDIQNIGVGQATLGLRYYVTPLLDVGGAFGGIRYFADERALFAEGSDLYPMVELAAGLNTPLLDRRISLHAAGQLHQFGLPVLRQSGAEDGVVVRVLLQAGFLIGRNRS